MKTKDEYSIKISGINSEWPNYRLWKNGKDIFFNERKKRGMHLF